MRACGALGVTACVDGIVTERCRPGAPAADDRTCDARDDDCDGATDEDAPTTPSTCGVGACATEGETRCVDGEWLDTCAPGERAAPDDRRCDGVDEDCDGLVDEDCDSPTPDDAGPLDSDAGATPKPDAGDTPDADDTPDAGETPDAGDLPDADESDAHGEPPTDEHDARALPDQPDWFVLPEPTIDAFVIPGTDIIVPDNAQMPQPVVSCDCRAAGGADARPLAALLALGLAGLRLRRRGSRRSGPRA